MMNRRNMLLASSGALLTTAAKAAVPDLVMTGHLGTVAKRLWPFFSARGPVIGIDKKEGPEFDMSIGNRAWVNRLGWAKHVIHLAAWTEKGDDEEQCRRNNIVVALELAEAARVYGTEHIIFASSTWAQPERYGNPEAKGAFPIQWYGFSKLFGEEVMRDLPRHGVRVTIVRIGVVPRETQRAKIAKSEWLQKVTVPDDVLCDCFLAATQMQEPFAMVDCIGPEWRMTQRG